MTRALAALAVTLLLAGIASRADGTRLGVHTPGKEPGAGVSLAELVGQTILVRMPGLNPTPIFLRRIRQGQIGGVILFSENFGPAGPKTLVHTLQAAAKAGHQPPLLIGIDQEGGEVKRLPGAPSLAPPEMANPIIAQAQGLATARNLAASDINVDLAPVLDIGGHGFITPRTFGTTPQTVSNNGLAFAKGLRQGGVMPVGKHFPGLGWATNTTDKGADTVTASKDILLADLAPYRVAVKERLPLIMVSTAVYPTLGAHLPAACSATIVTGLLRKQLRYQGVVITDALDTPAVTTYLSAPEAALRALKSGIDMVLAAGTTSTDANAVSAQTFAAILQAARAHAISRATLEKSYALILALKKQLRS